MKKLFFSLLVLALSILLACPPVGTRSAAASGSSLAGTATSLPLPEYPLGSFFTKNGKHCSCHASADCIASGSDCNCMRYWPTGKKSNCEIDLLGVQCIGFARLCQYRLYGAIDYGETAGRFSNLLGKRLSAGRWTASTAKTYITQAGMGGHIRIGGHSIVILSVSEKGFVSYECNSSVAGRECMVFSRSFTWQSFYSAYKNADWHYLNVIKAAYRPAESTTPTHTEPEPPVTEPEPPVTEPEPPVTEPEPPVTETKPPVTEPEPPVTEPEPPVTEPEPPVTEPEPPVTEPEPPVTEPEPPVTEPEPPVTEPEPPVTEPEPPVTEPEPPVTEPLPPVDPAPKNAGFLPPSLWRHDRFDLPG